MIIPPASDQPQEDRPIPAEALNALIGRRVVLSLGTPGDLLKVKVHHVGNDRYRVNVLVGNNAGSARIANSFFLTADGEGNIVDSRPKLVRMY